SVVTPISRIASAISISISVKPPSRRAVGQRQQRHAPRLAIPVVLAAERHRELDRAADAADRAGLVRARGRAALTAAQSAQLVALALGIADPLALDLDEAAVGRAGEALAVLQQ